MSKKKRWGINRKMLTSTLILSIVINVISCFGGAISFDAAIQKQYNEKGYVIGELILNQLDHDKIAEYTRTWEADEYYSRMEAYLHFVEETSDAAYIYIAVPYEDKTMRYVYDTSTYIGDTDPIAASFYEIWDCYTNGTRPTSYLVRHSKKYGFLTSSCLPVKDSTGNVVALLFVDTSMDKLQLILLSFIFTMVLISLILLVFFGIVYWYYMHRNLIAPLIHIRNNVRDFAVNNVQITDNLEDIRTGDELEDLAVSVNTMEKDIVTYIDNIQAITAEKERISAELNVATKIQADMLPRIFPAFPDRGEFDIFATMDPAKEVGGDFYDFFLIDEDHLAMVMADVSGKGVPAALFMVIAKTLIKNRTLTGSVLSPAAILSDVNSQLCEGNDAELFVTVWFGILEISTGKGIASNAGHEYPALKRAHGKYELVKYRHSPAIAIMDGIKFEEHEFELHPGDSFFVYADGVTEATSAQKELFGTYRMLSALNREPDASTEKMLINVKQSIDNFVGDAGQFDDITMMSFKYLGSNK